MNINPITISKLQRYISLKVPFKDRKRTVTVHLTFSIHIYSLENKELTQYYLNCLIFYSNMWYFINVPNH